MAKINILVIYNQKAEKPYSMGPHKTGVHPGRYMHQHHKAKKYIYRYIANGHC